MVPSISRKMARGCERLLPRIDRKDTRQLECLSHRLRKPEDREAIRPLAGAQTFEGRSYFSQVRMSIQVNVAMANGMIPISRFFPSHGRANVCRRASKLKVPLPRIHPA